MEAIQIKRLSDKDDLAKLVAGDIVVFGVHKETSLVYDYPGLNPGELFLLSRLKMTGIDMGIGIIFGDSEELEVDRGAVCLTYKRFGKKLPTTKDGKFHYGVEIITPRERTEEYNVFDSKLREAGL